MYNTAMNKKQPQVQVNVTGAPVPQTDVSGSGKYIIDVPVQPAPVPKKEPQFPKYYAPKTAYPQSFEIRFDQNIQHSPPQIFQYIKNKPA